MEKKLVKVPFKVELAKKIINGEVDGRIVTRDGKNVRILCFDRKGSALPIIALVEIKCGVEDYFSFYINGHYDIYENNSKDIMLEICKQLTIKKYVNLFAGLNKNHYLCIRKNKKQYIT